MKTNSLTHTHTNTPCSPPNSWEKENAVSPPTCKSPHVKGAVLNCSSSDKKYRELLNLYNDETQKKNTFLVARRLVDFSARACTLLRCIRNSREKSIFVGHQLENKPHQLRPMQQTNQPTTPASDETQNDPLPQNGQRSNTWKKLFPCVCVRFSWAQSAVVRMLSWLLQSDNRVLCYFLTKRTLAEKKKERTRSNTFSRG
jgi:hypothetical protein